MKSLSLLVLLAAVSGGLTADPDPKKDVKKTPTIRFPDPPAVAPMPQPLPPAPAAVGGAQKLGRGQFYVIEATKPYLIISDGTGEVSVVEKRGPFPLPADAVVGRTPDPLNDGFVTFEGPYLYFVKAVKSGDVTLTVVPALNDLDDKGKQISLKPTDFVKRKIEVDDGTGPRPPPVPVDPPVPPKPVDPPPSPTQELRLVFVFEDEILLTKEQSDVMNSTKLVEWMNKNCVKDRDDGLASWRKWDIKKLNKPDALKFETPTWKQVWNDSKAGLGTLPQVVVYLDQKGKSYDWPVGDEDKMLAFLKEKSGRK